jgi:hypothetical protein
MFVSYVSLPGTQKGSRARPPLVSHPKYFFALGGPGTGSPLSCGDGGHVTLTLGHTVPKQQQQQQTTVMGRIHFPSKTQHSSPQPHRKTRHGGGTNGAISWWAVSTRAFVKKTSHCFVFSSLSSSFLLEFVVHYSRRRKKRQIPTSFLLLDTTTRCRYVVVVPVMQLR